MIVLNKEEINFVSGGDLDVTVTAKVPTDVTGAFASALGMLLTGQLDAMGLSELIHAGSESFNRMPVEAITVGNYVITRIA